METKQRVSFTHEGKLFIETDNGTVIDGVHKTELNGNFIISVDDVARLLNRLEDTNVERKLVEVMSNDFRSSFQCEKVTYSILANEETAEKFEEILKSKDEEIKQLKIKKDNDERSISSVHSRVITICNKVLKHHPRFFRKHINPLIEEKWEN